MIKTQPLQHQLKEEEREKQVQFYTEISKKRRRSSIKDIGDNNNNNNIQTRKDFTKEKLEKYIQILLAQQQQQQQQQKEADHQNNNKLSSQDYYIRRHYAITKYRDKWVLIDKRNNIVDEEEEEELVSQITTTTAAAARGGGMALAPPLVVPYVYFEEIYDIIKLAHLTCIHGGVKKTLEEVKKHAANIKIAHVKCYISLCDKCQSLKLKKNPLKHIPVTKPIVSKEFGQRGQVDLIDTRNFKGNENCNFILNYQDNKTKFCILRPLTDKTPESVIQVLEDIFCTFGAPKILHTDNGGEFVNKKLKNYLSQVWPEANHIRGKPYNPRSQGSVERANRHVKDLLKRWYLENENTSLQKSLPYIQFLKNKYFHRTINMTPYEALFGQKPPISINLFRVDDDDEND